MKKNLKNGFTLVELLAVIVILAIILVIAVPKVMSIIEDAKMGTLESTAKMIASQAEKQKVQNTVLGNEGNITCEGITNINKEDYPSCEITFEDNTAKVTIAGGGKFDGLYVCGGTKTEAKAQKGKCLITLIVDLNEGTDTVDYNSKYEAGSEVTLTEPTKEGYTFNGWIVTGTGASVNGSTLTIGTGKTTVTAIWQEMRNLSTDDWATIVAKVKEAKQNGTAYPYIIGSEKTIDMGSLGTHTIRVANTTKCAELETEPLSKTACGFVLEFADIITIYNMNPAGEYYGTQYNYGTNLGGWPASEMRTYVNNDIYNALPEELRNGIINTYVVSSYGKDKTTGVVENENAGVLESELYWSNDKLYLLSPQEIYGTSFTESYDKSNGTSMQLDYYATYEGEGYTGVSKSNYEGAKKQRAGSADWWWLRSASSDGSSDFSDVQTSGVWLRDSSYFSGGVSPAFRLAN